MKSHHLVDVFNVIWLSLVTLIIIGVVTKPAIYDYVSFFIKLLVSLFLIYKFNDFRHLHVFTELDKRICFMAGTNLFMITCADLIDNVILNIKIKLKKIESTLHIYD
jgi:hypothetical protein